MHFSKRGGNMGGTGSVAYNFKRMGVFRLDPEGIDQDDLELELIDFGLEEMGEAEGENGQPLLVVRCAFNDFGDMQKAIEERGMTPLSVQAEYIPLNTISLSEEQAAEVLDIIDRLEGDDDVQQVFHNLV